jgi:hypothetical protein
LELGPSARGAAATQCAVTETLERMAEKMQQAGYIADNGVDTLLDALKNDARVGPQFSMNDLPEAAWQRAAMVFPSMMVGTAA